jgi:hypothetical protein
VREQCRTWYRQYLPRRSIITDLVPTVFIDGPHILQPVDLAGSAPQQSPALTLESLGAAEAASDPTLTPRAWWKVNPERTEARGLAESLAVVRDVLRTRKFDVSRMFFCDAKLMLLTVIAIS